MQPCMGFGEYWRILDRLMHASKLVVVKIEWDEVKKLESSKRIVSLSMCSGCTVLKSPSRKKKIPIHFTRLRTLNQNRKSR